MALVVAFLGLFAAGVLSVSHLLNLPVPCGRSQGCVAVANHPSSKVFGVPIAFIGVAAYLTMIFLLGNAVASRRARIAFAALAGLGTVLSAGLLIYAQTVIRATCWWCVASGVAMTLLLVLAVAMLRARGPMRAVKPGMVFGLGLLTAAALGVQAGQMQRTANQPPIPAERLASVTAEELVDPAKSLGPSDASVTVVMFSDLWCPACRAAHASLVKYLQANPDRVRLVYRHLPLWEIRGHEFSGTAAALSEIAAEEGKFWPFVDLVYRQRNPLNREGYLQLMSHLGVRTEDLEARLADPEDAAVARVQTDMALADRLGVSATPTFLVLVGDRPPISANLRTLPRILTERCIEK